jgi:hypothetical protein
MDQAEASLDQFGDSFNLGLFGDSFNLGLFADSVKLGASKVHGLRRTHHRLITHFLTHLIVLLVAWIMQKLILICLEIVLISTQDRCTVCSKYTMGIKIILGTPDGTPR